jgi:hypothetical protein
MRRAGEGNIRTGIEILTIWQDRTEGRQEKTEAQLTVEKMQEKGVGTKHIPTLA